MSIQETFDLARRKASRTSSRTAPTPASAARSSQSGLAGNATRQSNSPVSKQNVTINPRRLGRRAERGHIGENVGDRFIVRERGRAYFETDARIAQDLAIIEIAPPGCAGMRASIRFRSRALVSSSSDIAKAGAGPCPPRNGCQ